MACTKLTSAGYFRHSKPFNLIAILEYACFDLQPASISMCCCSEVCFRPNFNALSSAISLPIPAEKPHFQFPSESRRSPPITARFNYNNTNIYTYI